MGPAGGEPGKEREDDALTRSWQGRRPADGDARPAGALTTAEPPPGGDSLDLLAERLIAGPLEAEDLAPREETPAAIDRFRIVGELGRGGMGVVYRAVDEELGRDVALKRMNATAWSTRDVERFRREGRAMARVDHPGIVRLFEVGVGEAGCYLVMELVEGETLATRMRAGMAPEEVARVGAELAEALASVHAAGIVHRDVKPGNVLLRHDTGRAQLLDFGLAYDPEASRLTHSGGLVGTLVYMAPEQGDGPSRPPADVYSLGATLYEALAGVPPFEADTVLTLLKRLATEEPRPLRDARPELDPRLADWVQRCLDKEPARRPSAVALAEGLRELRATPPPPPPPSPPRRPRGLIVLSLLAAALAIGLLREREAPGPAAPPAATPEPAPPSLSVASGGHPFLSGPYRTVGWGVADPGLSGVELVERRALVVVQGPWLEFPAPGRSRAEARFTLGETPGWGRLFLRCQSARAGLQQPTPVRLRLNGRLICDGAKLHGEEVFDVGPALQAGPNRLELLFQRATPAGEQACGRFHLRSLQFAFGPGPAPRPREHLRWAPGLESSVELLGELALGRSEAGSLRFGAPGASQAQLGFRCAPAPRWVRLMAGLEYPARNNARLELYLNGRLLRRDWSGQPLLVPGSYVREGLNLLFLRLERAAPLEVWLKGLSVTSGEGPAPLGDLELITAPREGPR